MSRAIEFATGIVLSAMLAGCIAAPKPTSFAPGPTTPVASGPPATASLAPLAGSVLVTGNRAVASWSPDGQHLLVQDVAGGMPSVFDLGGAKVADLAATHAEWLGPRSLLLWTDRGVVGQGLDQGRVAAPDDVTAGALVGPTGAIAYDNGDVDAPTFRVWTSATTTKPRAGQPVAWSPDGSRLVVWLPAGPTPITGPENLGHLALLAWPGLATVRELSGLLTTTQPPEFDASGQHLAFFAKGEIQVLDIASATVNAASEGNTGSDAFAWGSDGRLFWVDASGDVVATPASGGSATTVGPGDTVTSSPDGSLVAYYFAQSTTQTTVRLLAPSTGRTSTIEAPGPIEPTLAIASGGQSVVLLSTPGVILYVLGA